MGLIKGDTRSLDYGSDIMSFVVSFVKFRGGGMFTLNPKP